MLYNTGREGIFDFIPEFNYDSCFLTFNVRLAIDLQQKSFIVLRK